jgi:aspartyl-tRNA(Asn)/glutamyl-tRNA(Gln) amidotransferase subunit C
MSVDTTTVRHIAKLARIAMSDAEARRSSPSSTTFSGWVEQLQEVDVEGVEPMTAVYPEHASPARRSGHRGVASATPVLANAPVAEHGFFAVPKVIE